MPWWLYPPSPLAAASLGLVATTAPRLESSIGIGYAGIAALFVVQMLGAVLGAASVGVSGARMLRPVPLCALGAMALALSLAAGSLAALVPLLALSGFAAFGVNARAQGDLSRIAGDRRASALGVFHVFGGTGAFLFPFAVAGLVWGGVSWRGPFLLVAAAFAAYGVVCRRWRETADPPGLHLEVLRRLVRGNAGAALVVAVLGTGLQLAVLLWIPVLAHDRFGWSAALASVIAGISALALLASRVASAALVGRVGARPILVTGAAALVAGHVVLFAAPDAALLVLAAVLVGAGSGPLLPVGIARVAHWSREDRLGTAAVMALAGLAQILLPATVVAARAAGLPLQHAAAVTVVPALLVLAAAPRA